MAEGQVGGRFRKDGKPRILAELWGVRLSKSQPRVQKTAGRGEGGKRGSGSKVGLTDGTLARHAELSSLPPSPHPLKTLT